MVGSARELSSAVLLVAGIFGFASNGGGTAPGAREAQHTTLTGSFTSAGNACEAGVHALRLGSGRRAVMRVTAGGDGGKKALILVLHGSGGSSNDGLYAFRGAWDAGGVVMVAPSARGRTWSLLLGKGDDLPTVDRALSQAFSRCLIDPKRVAVAGFSDGATYALSLGVTNGRLFHAVMALSPGSLIAENRTGKPRIFIAHGTRDHVLPFSRTRDELVPDLRAQGYAVTFRAFAGGHTAPEPISRAAVKWFLR
jgi:phospholipase/carboxylesterase